MKDWKSALNGVKRAINDAAIRHDRAPTQVRLLAVSKRHPATAIRHLAAYGQTAFGENYLSEAVGKMEALADLALEWHFIGPVQSNKTASIARYFDWVHSVDREKILRRLATQRPDNMPPLNCCLQIRIGEEISKSGARSDEATTLARLADKLPNIKLRGLMCIPPLTKDMAQQRAWFAQLRELKERLCRAGHTLDTLSMGMSGDLDSAIAEGATIVRVGTALFGPRQP